MIDLLSITNSLSRALERKEQNNVDAMSLIVDMKDKLWDVRDNGLVNLFKRVKSFCEKMRFKVPKMDKEENTRGTSTYRRQKVTNMHFYNVW